MALEEAEVANDFDQQLQEAKINLLNPRLQKATTNFENLTWARIGPAIADYLRGMTPLEVCRKHKLIDRCEFYRIIKIAKINRPSNDMKCFIGKYRIKEGRISLPDHIIKCHCETCAWLKARAQRINNNDLQ